MIKNEECPLYGDINIVITIFWVNISIGFYCGQGNCLKDDEKTKAKARTMTEWLMYDLVSHDCCVPIPDTKNKKMSQEGNL